MKSITLGVAVLAASLSATCAIAATPAAAVPALAPATITVASFPDLDRAVKTALPLWEKLYPQVKVKLVSLQIDDHHNSMTTALAAGARLPPAPRCNMMANAASTAVATRPSAWPSTRPVCTTS